MFGRNLRRYQRQPQIAVFVLVQPIMFVLLFRYVFGGSIPTPGLDYVQYLMPGIIVQSVTFSTIGTAIGIAEDLKGGMLDRFRSLPMSRSAVLSGRILADVLVSVVSLVVMLAVAYLVGFRITTGPLQALGALLLIVALSLAFARIAAYTGLALKEHNTLRSEDMSHELRYVPENTSNVVRIESDLSDRRRGLLLGCPCPQLILYRPPTGDIHHRTLIDDTILGFDATRRISDPDRLAVESVHPLLEPDDYVGVLEQLRKMLPVCNVHVHFIRRELDHVGLGLGTEELKERGVRLGDRSVRERSIQGDRD
ncbi:MAG: ABC transporter permease, partial [Actinomycetota bacterium]